MDLEEIQKLCELTERCEAAEARVEELERSLNAKWSDHMNGTPCAAIHWAHERDNYLSYIEELKELLKVPLEAYLQHVAGEPVTVEDLDVWIGRVQQALADAPVGHLHSDDEARGRLKAQWQADILIEYHQYAKGAKMGGREPMSAHEWASEVLERARQAEGE